MKNVTFKMLMMACFLLVASYANAQFKQGDKSTIGQTWTTDAETGKCVLTTTFNPDKDPSSYTMDADTALISLAKCTTNKGMQIEVRDTAGNKVYNGDFKCKSYRSYDNPVFVAGTDALVDILNMYENNEAVGKTTGNTTSDSIPAHCIFKVAEGGTNGDGAFGAWPGQWKDVKYDFYYRPKGFNVTEDITFDIMTVYPGSANLGGATASYALRLKVGSLDSTITDFYVSGQPTKAVQLAAAFGEDPSIFSSADIYITVFTEGTGTDVAIDKIDPVIAFDNMTLKCEAAVWVDPSAGLDGNGVWDNADEPAVGPLEEDATYSLHLQTIGRSGSFQIVDDLQNKTFKQITFDAIGAVKGNDGAGNYTVDIPYTLSQAVLDAGTLEWSKAKITIASPELGKVNDDFMLVFTAKAKAITQVNRFELDCGTRIFYDFSYKVKQEKVAYVTYDKVMSGEYAAQVDEDPIIKMLMADPLIDLDVMVVAADSVFDLSGYAAVIGQETFSSSAAIFKAGGSLAMGSIPVPFILNKAYTMKAGRGFASGAAGSGGEKPNVMYLKASAANQANDLFKGLVFDGDSVQVFRATADDNGGDTGTKALQYATDVKISAANTLLANGTMDPDNVTVCLNDIPAGDSIGSEKLQARMIAMAMNFGAISKDAGTNFTAEGLTIWRNAVYSLVGLVIPDMLVDAPNPLAKLKHSYTFEDKAVTDVVAGANGEAMGGTFKNGMYVASANGEYISLPADEIAINTYPAISVELYITADGADVGANVMTSYFGSTNASNGFGNDYFFTSHKSRAAISCLNTDTPWGAEKGVSGDALADGARHHLVSTLNNEMISLYVDGALVNTAAVGADNKIANISNALAYLCKSGYSGDVTWQGSIHEYNIYQGELTPEEVAAKAASWPVEKKTAGSVAYVTNSGADMDVTAAMATEDPIITMLEADPNIDLTVMSVAADSVFDLSGYDAVIGQESFSSSAAIFKAGGSLAMGSIPVPFILNKAYTMKAGRGFASGTAGSGGEKPNVMYLKATVDNQTNDLFKGVTFDGDSVQVFKSTATDDGSEGGTKALQYATDVKISAENTLLANGVMDPDNVTVCINDIPAGDSIGSEKLQARMIAMAMNFGAICKDDGTNFTNEGLTIWRNAVYSLIGLDIPDEVIIARVPNKKVAYVTNSGADMDASAASPLEDPIIKMLEADANISLTVMSVAADSVFDLSDYDVVIGQESFSSSATILKPGGSLAMGSVPVPFILNKAYTMKAGRGFATGAAGSGGEKPNVMYLKASAANQANDLFKGLVFDGDSVQVFRSTANDNGSEGGTKALQYATDVVITSAASTLLANGTMDPDNVTVCINDIPAGDSIGSEKLQARMIAMAMNFGAISKDGGRNFTSEGLTIWRNAVYSLANLNIPAEMVMAPAPKPTMMHSYTFEDGTASDVVGDLDGTLNGESLTIADGMATVAGSTGPTSGYISLDAAALALNTYSAISLEAYVKTSLNANDSYSMLAYFGNNVGGNKCFWMQPTRSATESRVETNNGTSTVTALLDGTEIDDGENHHVVAVLSGSALQYYLDGVLVAESATNGDFITTLDNVVANIFKGPDAWGDKNYNASLSEFNIYDGELNAGDVAAKAAVWPNDGSVGVRNVDIASGLTLYPNPARDFATLRIEMKNPALAQLSIYNMVGQMSEVSVSQQLNAGVNEMSIDTQSLKRGMYIFVLKAGGQSYQGKINIVK